MKQLKDVNTTPTRSSVEETTEVKGALEERTPRSRVIRAYIDGSGNVCKIGEHEFGTDVGAGSKAGMGDTEETFQGTTQYTRS